MLQGYTFPFSCAPPLCKCSWLLVSDHSKAQARAPLLLFPIKWSLRNLFPQRGLLTLPRWHTWTFKIPWKDILHYHKRNLNQNCSVYPKPGKMFSLLASFPQGNACYLHICLSSCLLRTQISVLLNSFSYVILFFLSYFPYGFCHWSWQNGFMTLCS